MDCDPLLDFMNELPDVSEGSPSHQNMEVMPMGQIIQEFGLQLPPRLDEILTFIKDRTPWPIDESPYSHDAALILAHRDNLIVLHDFPRCKVANKVHQSEPCVFLVDKAMPSAGKRKKTAAAASSSGQPDDEDEWVKYSGSGSQSLVDLPNHEAVLKIHCSLPTAVADMHGKKKIGQYCIVLRPGHPEWDKPFPSNKPREVESVKKNGEEYKHKDEQHLYLMHSMPEGTAARPRPPALMGDSLEVNGDAAVGGSLRVVGSIYGRFEGGRADFAELMPRYSLEEQLSGGDVVALVGNREAEHASISRSARGSLTPLWRVVTTDPLLLGKPSPDVDEETQVGIVRVGQVPVRVVGEPPTDAYLVPSGDEDGRARALRDGERPRHVVGRVVASKVRNGRVEALVESGLEAALSSDYFEGQMNLLRDEIVSVKTDNVSLRAQAEGAQAEAERMRVENGRLRSAESAMQGLSVGPDAPSGHNSAASPARPESPVPVSEGTAANAPIGVRIDSAAYQHVPRGRYGSAPRVADPPPKGSHVGFFCRRSMMNPIIGNRYHNQGGSLPNLSFDLCEAEYEKLSDGEKALYEKMPPAEQPPAPGEWPWDVPGTVGFDGKVITPSVALLNRMDYKHKLFSSRSVGGMAVRVAGDASDTHFYTARVTIASSGRTIISTECAGCTVEEATEDASRRVLEAEESVLMQLLAEAENESGEEAEDDGAGQGAGQNAGQGGGQGGAGGEAGGGSSSSGVCGSEGTAGSSDAAATGSGVKPMSTGDLNTLAATTGKQRLNAMAMRLCRVSMEMAALQKHKLVVYAEQEAFDSDERLMQRVVHADNSSPYMSVADVVDDVLARTRYSAALPLCEGQPRVYGAVAKTRKASQHSAAERTIAFVDRVLESFSDPSYNFRFAELAELLAELREMRRTQGSSMRSSFKELLNVMAMRLKRPAWDEPHDGSVEYLRYIPVAAGEGGGELGLSEHGTPLEVSEVAFVRFDGEPTFTGTPAAGRRAAEQAAAEAALAFIFERVAELRVVV